MTYANDCIEARQRQKRRGLKRITRHTDAELNSAIEVAFRKFGEDFYLMLHGIDAYMERRKRNGARRATGRKLRLKHAITMANFVGLPDAGDHGQWND